MAVVVERCSPLDRPRMLVDDLRFDGRRRIVSVGPRGWVRRLSGAPPVWMPVVHVHIRIMIVVTIRPLRVVQHVGNSHL